MSDIWTKEKRSQVMSRIRSRGNRTTELRMVALFREHRITGWRRHQPLPGRPDFAFRREKVAVFVDGCFWHGCPVCYREPTGNREFWRQKIERNCRRDRKVTQELRRLGWSVLRVRECALRKHPEQAFARICRKLADRTAAG